MKDFAGANDYRIVIPRVMAKIKHGTERSLRRAARDLCVDLVSRNPVDDGTSRGNWYAGEFAFSVEADWDNNDPSGRSSLVRMAEAINSWDARTHFNIANPLPYVARLEFDSWSKQAPNGWIRLSLAEVPTKWIKRFGIEFHREPTEGEVNLGVGFLKNLFK